MSYLGGSLANIQLKLGSLPKNITDAFASPTPVLQHQRLVRCRVCWDSVALVDGRSMFTNLVTLYLHTTVPRPPMQPFLNTIYSSPNLETLHLEGSLPEGLPLVDTDSTIVFPLKRLATCVIEDSPLHIARFYPRIWHPSTTRGSVSALDYLSIPPQLRKGKTWLYHFSMRTGYQEKQHL
ncbi:hypothetical protein BDV98DRAFT_594723 [Pterulicium gracile]|uniref:F-box domain-containing protein n=1 Tax=Pterulicium gracile TaxID=1884261 RepID=A0A5C3QH35_9AGAR|nr:hypothetical protein BDV98DRAFT_594723 [Pterula gracilis]